MRDMKLRQVQMTGVVTAVLNILAKWLIGVLIQKLIVISSGASALQASSFFNLIFLERISFQGVAIMSGTITILLSISSAAMGSLALLRSSQTGRRLRSEILACAVSAASSTAGADNNASSSDLCLKVQVVENFQSFDEHWILVKWLILGLSFVLTFVFAWYAGLIALALFVFSEAGASLVQRCRAPFHMFIEENMTRVNSRLLDVIKNGAMIKTMDMTSSEGNALRQLEEESDESRSSDVKLKFFAGVMRLTLVGLVPVAMAIAAWPVITNASTLDAVDHGFAILASILLLDEGHKSIIYLSFVYDRKVLAVEALNTINAFLDSNRNSSDSIELTASEDDNHVIQEKAADYDVEKNESALVEVPMERWTKLEDEDSNEIALEDLLLKYPDRITPVFFQHTQHFVRGSIHALVGESGSGKSTLLKILGGLLLPNAGQMRLWQGARVAYVSQDQKLFARSIRENVSYGSTVEVSDEEIYEALEWANIRPFVDSLPNGLDEVMEGGENDVSGGQLQRLQLAHLYCTSQDADVVLLDEVLSAVDQTSRELLIDRLGEFLSGKTAIIVTHHAEMLRICSEVHEVKPTSSKRCSVLTSIRAGHDNSIVGALGMSQMELSSSGRTITSSYVPSVGEVLNA